MEAPEHPLIESVYISRLRVKLVKNPDPFITTDNSQARAYEMLDEPVPNLRYGDWTMRRAMLKALRHAKPKSNDEPVEN